MCRRSGARPNRPPPLRRHPLSHALCLHSFSIAEKNQPRLKLSSGTTIKSAATTPAPAAAGRNIKSVTEREEKRSVYHCLSIRRLSVSSDWILGYESSSFVSSCLTLHSRLS